MSKTVNCENQTCVFFGPGAGMVILELRAVFHLSKMRAHVAADARITSGTLYL